MFRRDHFRKKLSERQQSEGLIGADLRSEPLPM